MLQGGARDNAHKTISRGARVAAQGRVKKYARDTVQNAFLRAGMRHRSRVYEKMRTRRCLTAMERTLGDAQDATYTRTKSRARDYRRGCARGRLADAARPWLSAVGTLKCRVSKADKGIGERAC